MIIPVVFTVQQETQVSIHGLDDTTLFYTQNQLRVSANDVSHQADHKNTEREMLTACLVVKRSRTFTNITLRAIHDM